MMTAHNREFFNSMFLPFGRGGWGMVEGLMELKNSKKEGITNSYFLSKQQTSLLQPLMHRVQYPYKDQGNPLVHQDNLSELKNYS